MALKLRALFLAVVCGWLAAAGAFAAEDRTASIDAARATLTEVRSAIDSEAAIDVGDTADTLRNLREESRTRLVGVERELEAVRAQLDLLGPAPAEGEPAESESVASQRADLESQRSRLTGERTQINANIIESNDLLNRLSAMRVGAVYLRLLERGPSPLSPSALKDGAASFSEITGRIQTYFAKWSERKRGSENFAFSVFLIAIAALASLMLFGPVNRFISETFSKHIEQRKPNDARRVIVAGLKMIARAAPGVIGGMIIIETLRAQGVINEQGEAPARALWVGIVSILLVSGFTSGFFAPANPQWRIAAVDAERGRRISALAMWIVVVFFLKTLIESIAIAAGGSDMLVLLIQASGAVVMGALFFLIARSRLWRPQPNADGSAAPSPPANAESSAGNGDKWRLLRRFGRAAAVAIIALALAGYVELADFAATRVCYLALLIGLVWLIRSVMLELTWWARVQFEGAEKVSEIETHNFRFWSLTLINVALLIAVTPAFLILFGVPDETVKDLARQALFGFSIGGLQIPSVVNLIYAIAVFVGVLAVTKFIQRAIERGPLAHTQIDSGVQDSLITLLGYAGLIIAVIAGVSTIGFDLGNLALIAGALSVGIGFGLQSIVNNFVSGLILLFERPIKVGDWIVTPSGEGTVKKISVRSTEIETFDRSSIIVPNSELISSTVTNWTHKNKIGRITVPVGVSYNADPEKVREILLKCAHDHPLIVSYPEPFVTWMDFGASSLDFEIRAYLGDISKGLSVRTDLRFAIFKALAEAGIEIPFPQRDVHVKSWPEPPGGKGEGADA